MTNRTPYHDETGRLAPAAFPGHLAGAVARYNDLCQREDRLDMRQAVTYGAAAIGLAAYGEVLSFGRFAAVVLAAQLVSVVVLDRFLNLTGRGGTRRAAAAVDAGTVNPHWTWDLLTLADQLNAGHISRDQLAEALAANAYAVVATPRRSRRRVRYSWLVPLVAVWPPVWWPVAAASTAGYIAVSELVEWRIRAVSRARAGVFGELVASVRFG